MYQTKTDSILSLLYLATPEGRHEYRVKYHDSCIGNNTELDGSDFSLKVIPKLEEMLKIVSSETYFSKEGKINSLFANYIGEFVDQTSGKTIEHDELDIDLLKKILFKKLKQTEKSDLKMTTAVKLNSLVSSGDPTSIIKQEAYLQFGIEYWRKVLEDAKQVNFAKFILTLLALPSSEAVCERAFWYQRRVIGDQGMSMGPTTEIKLIIS